MQKTFIIPCIWQMYEKLEIKAETLEQAKELAAERIRNFHHGQGDAKYIDDSFELDTEEIINQLNSKP